MQDTHTGELVHLADDSQATRDAALPRERQGPVFHVGEKLEIKGGRFAVSSIGNRMIVLRSLPGTDIQPGLEIRSNLEARGANGAAEQPESPLK